MKVAIISDIHENFHNLFLALEKIKEKNCKQIICLGDMMNTGIAKVLSKSEMPVFGIWGNNDGDCIQILTKACTGKSNLKMGKGSYDFLELESKKIFLTHYPDIAFSMAKSGDFDVVLYGHTHEKDIQKIDDCIIINPGEISAHKSSKASFAMYDTITDEVNFVELENSMTLRTDYVVKKFEEFGFKY